MPLLILFTLLFIRITAFAAPEETRTGLSSVDSGDVAEQHVKRIEEQYKQRKSECIAAPISDDPAVNAEARATCEKDLRSEIEFAELETTLSKLKGKVCPADGECDVRAGKLFTALCRYRCQAVVPAEDLDKIKSCDPASACRKWYVRDQVERQVAANRCFEGARDKGWKTLEEAFTTFPSFVDQLVRSPVEFSKFVTDVSVSEAKDLIHLGGHDYIAKRITSVYEAGKRTREIPAAAQALIKQELLRLECLSDEAAATSACAFGAALAIEMAGKRGLGLIARARTLHTIHASAKRLATAVNVAHNHALFKFDSAKPFFQKLLSVCGDCRSVYVGKETIEHSSSHVAKPWENVLEDRNIARGRARPNVATTVFTGDISLDEVVRLAVDSREIDLGPIPKDGNTATRAFDSIIRYPGREQAPMRVRVVVCAEPVCEEKGLKFRRGEVQSVFPICGPGVVYIPPVENFLRAEDPHANKADRKSGRVKEKLCTEIS